MFHIIFFQTIHSYQNDNVRENEEIIKKYIYIYPTSQGTLEKTLTVFLNHELSPSCTVLNFPPIAFHSNSINSFAEADTVKILKNIRQ